MVKNLSTLFLLLIFSAQMATGQIRLKSELLHDYNVTVGQTVDGEIVLENRSDHGREVRVYQQDYQFDYLNQTHFSAPNTEARSNSSWISLPDDYVYMEAGETVRIPYQMMVPPVDDAGTYWSVIMVEPTDSAARETEQEIAVNIKTRYALQVATHLRNGEIRKGLEVLGHDFVSSGDTLTFAVASRNTGNIAYRSNVEIKVYDNSGTVVRSWNGQDSRLYPQSSSTVQYQMEGLEPGNYKVIVIYDTGDDDVYGAQYQLEINNG